MGGRAFKDLNCPRINPDVYNKVKAQATTALQTVFAHVVVPAEMPEKSDYGDVDFLVCDPLQSPGTYKIHDFPWEETVQLIKDALGTIHGRRGYLTNDCMYFAVSAPCDGNYYIQIDVKVCFKPELFKWYTFELNYASSSKIFGSMIKPLGLTIDPEGIHIRGEDIEETDHNGSMVWLSKDPKDALRIAGLDHRIVHAGFDTKEELYHYFTSSWLFHPAHFATRLAEKKYKDRFEDRSPHWIHFIKVWIPEHYPGHRLHSNCSASAVSEDGSSQHHPQDLQAWYQHTRSAVRDKVFTMFPNVAKEYYAKRAAYLKKQQEQRLTELLMKSIPIGAQGWKSYISSPTVIFTILDPEPKALHQRILPSLSTPPTQPHRSNTPIYLSPLPHEPPVSCTQRPPPPTMSIPAKLACLTRWTDFDPDTGVPYVRCSPRPKDETMYWTDAVDAGTTEEVLLRWAREAWWSVWARQVVVNYVGMWRKRFEKEEGEEKGKAEGGD